MLSDYLWNRPSVMSFSTLLGFLSCLFLAVWSVPSGLKWLSFFISRAAVPYGPLSMSCANEIYAADAEE
jgi:ACS family pantothenate transporter-like MFS transporter